MKIIEKTKKEIEAIKPKIERLGKFENLIRPLSTLEFSTLENSIKEHGVLDKLTVWETKKNYYLIDGHHRHMIASRHNKTFDIRLVHFDTEQEVYDWMYNNQLSRRNSTKWEMDYFNGGQYELEKTPVGGDQSNGKNYRLNLAAHMARERGITEKTIRLNGKFYIGVNKICGEDSQLRWKILTRQLKKLNKEHLINTAELPECIGQFLNRYLVSFGVDFFLVHLDQSTRIFKTIIGGAGEKGSEFKAKLLEGKIPLPNNAFQLIHNVWVQDAWYDEDALSALGKFMHSGLTFEQAFKKVKNQKNEKAEKIKKEQAEIEKIREENRQRAHRIQNETKNKHEPSHKEVAQALLEKKAAVNLVAPKPKPTKEEARLEEIKATLAEKIKADPKHNYVCEMIGKSTRYYPVTKLHEQEKPRGFVIGESIVQAYHRIAGIKEGEPTQKMNEDVKHVLINLAINKGTMLATSKLSDSIIEICRKIFYGWFIEKSPVVLKWVKDQDFARNSSNEIAQWDIFFSVVKYGNYGKKMNEYLGLVGIKKGETSSEVVNELPNSKPKNYKEEVQAEVGEEAVANDQKKSIWEMNTDRAWKFYKQMFGEKITEHLKKEINDDAELSKKIAELVNEDDASEVSNRFFHYFEAGDKVPKALKKAQADQERLMDLDNCMEKTKAALEEMVSALYFTNYYLAEKKENIDHLKVTFKTVVLDLAEKMGVDLSDGKPFNRAIL